MRVWLMLRSRFTAAPATVVRRTGGWLGPDSAQLNRASPSFPGAGAQAPTTGTDPRPIVTARPQRLPVAVRPMDSRLRGNDGSRRNRGAVDGVRPAMHVWVAGIHGPEHARRRMNRQQG